ncbi:acyltransferase family-domain-containing protein [Hyaloscypha sp. PMI_1271]|nr:acyltransferase family-domain-containing protein [Hyaloscypha sp. PMI_1271]
MLSASAIHTSQAFNRFYDAGDPQADIEARSALSPKTKDRVRTGLGNGQLQRRTRTNQQLRDIIKPTYFFKRWHQKSQKLRPTAWLDGLRGVAALIVTIYHYAYLWPWAQTGWGVSKDDHHFMQFYVVRIITSGGFMVRIFFVISGYALSTRLVQLSRDRQYVTLFESLSSSAFRRWIRLMLPSAVSMIMEWSLTIMFSRSYRAKRSFFGHLGAIYHDVIGLTNAFQIGKYRPEFNKVLWTIPAELKGSVIVYMLMLGLARTRTVVKIPILLGAMIQCAWTSDRLLALFVAGLLMAEVDLLLKHRRIGAEQRWTHFFTSVQPYTFLFGIYLGSHPNKMDEAPGYILICSILRNVFGLDHYWMLEEACRSVGALLVVGSTNYSSILQRPFTTSFTQYLGDVSFSLYLIHFYILEWIAKPLVPYSLALFRFLGPDHKTLSYGCAVALIFAFVWPFQFLASDLYTRFIDAKAVKLAKVLEVWAIVPKDSGHCLAIDEAVPKNEFTLKS